MTRSPELSLPDVVSSQSEQDDTHLAHWHNQVPSLSSQASSEGTLATTAVLLTLVLTLPAYTESNLDNVFHVQVKIYVPKREYIYRVVAVNNTTEGVSHA